MQSNSPAIPAVSHGTVPPYPAGVSVVIPCLNEEESIGQVIAAVLAGLSKLNVPGEVLVVDNGCTDRSPEIARAAGARVIRENRRGYGSAIRRGFAESRYSVLVMGDGDLTYDFSELNVLVQPILDQKADFVIGNRMNNIQPGSMPALHRYIGNPLLSFMLRVLFRSNQVHDAHCGLRAISHVSYRELNCVTTGMEFASEMVISAIRKNLRVEERDIVYHPRLGESKLRSFQDGWRHVRFMMLHSPAMILLFPGILFWVVSLILAAPLAFGPIFLEGRAVDIHFMMMAGLINIVSMQVMTMGMLAKASAHIRGVRFDPVIAWFYRWFSFEKFSVLAGSLFLMGFLVSAAIIIQWVGSGFGTLDKARPLFFAALALINGVQIGLASYLFSVLALPVSPDDIDPHEAGPGD
jgi:glycosyltransferase involved in cell wall biosynthesis